MHASIRTLRSGFTTIELITSLVIIGIVAVVAIPRMNNTDAFKERSFHDALRSALDYARKSAVAARRYTCAVLTPGLSGSGKAEFFIDPNLTPEASAGSVDCATQRLILAGSTCAAGTLCAPNNVTLDTGGVPLTVVFSPLGEPQSQARVPIPIRQVVQVGTFSLTIEPLTGLVH